MSGMSSHDRFPGPQPREGKNPAAWRIRMHEIIFEADTPAGKLFDICLIIAIILSIIAVMFDSVAEVRAEHGKALYTIEWFFTLLFTVEYLARIISLGKPVLYIRSFYGLVDIIAILPTYLSLLQGSAPFENFQDSETGTISQRSGNPPESNARKRPQNIGVSLCGLEHGTDFRLIALPY